ncbi:helix-turn-helix domain-containing protein [Pseudomonas cichorii]|uniref:helix-turn-helix domain-containing protein n=1 Tax=Pseudomonas TaxID=286 RepID=UPI0018E5F0C2|nr:MULTISPECIES: helix-turn-helix domain-containing protein [Pseudomonas]MBI6853391.1 helix-turn-helix domain-containing protein [Pseudomonas cichorii]MCV4285902.1 helix-turn-helix domain-containing protein [Pseudomonas capsici]
MKKKKADPKASPNTSEGLKNTSINAQNQRFIERLRLGPIDTFTAMRELNICRPGARICDLRNSGHQINTARITLTDEWGRTHRGVAVYTLMAEPRSAA